MSIMTQICNNVVNKQMCRLCYCETNDLIDIYNDNDLFDVENKIIKYLYLQVSREDDLPKTICWMCSQHLDTFHKFCEKVNHIQKTVLKERYESMVAKPVVQNSTVLFDASSVQLGLKHEILTVSKNKEIANHDQLNNKRNNSEQQLYNEEIYDEEITSQENLDDSNKLSEELDTSINSSKESLEQHATYVENAFNEAIFNNIEYKQQNNIDTRSSSTETEYLQKSDLSIASDSSPLKDSFCDDKKKNYSINPKKVKIDDSVNFKQNTRLTRSKAMNATQESEQKLKTVDKPKRICRSRVINVAVDKIPIIMSHEQNTSSLDSDDEEIEDDLFDGDCDDEDNDKDFIIPAKKKLVFAIQDEDSDEDKCKEIVKKKRRGRPKGVQNKGAKSTVDKQGYNEDEEYDKEDTIDESPTKIKSKRSYMKKNRDLPLHDMDEGESDNELPARDSDNEDWPAQTTLNGFPEKILDNGLLLVKGKKLISMICKFYKLECDICKEKPRFKHLRLLFTHYTEKHNEEGYVSCCQTKLSRYPAIIMHMARHLQPDAFKCDICGYMVTRPRFLESHKQTHLPDEQKPYACDQCPRRFCWKGALQIHLISHQPVDERKLYICHICGKVYDTPGGLSTHKKLVHTDRKNESHVCHVCAKKFATRTGLNEHMATIHQPREKDQVKCDECGKWLMNNRCLKSHMILHSTVTYNCYLCNYKTKKRMLLNRHSLTQHSNDKPFVCNICEKAFKLKRALTVHIAQHSNTKSYKCTFCDRVFASSTNFYTHRKNMHPQELQEMKNKELEEQRQKRIKAGVEVKKTDEEYMNVSLEVEQCDDEKEDDVQQENVQQENVQQENVQQENEDVNKTISITLHAENMECCNEMPINVRTIVHSQRHQPNIDQRSIINFQLQQLDQPTTIIESDQIISTFLPGARLVTIDSNGVVITTTSPIRGDSESMDTNEQSIILNVNNVQTLHHALEQSHLAYPHDNNNT